MKMKTVIFFFTVCIFATSCVMTNQKSEENDLDISSANKSDNTQSINIDSLKKEDNINLSSEFKKVKTIILETNKNSLIGSVNSIQVYGDKIFILDRDKSNGIFVFNKTGKFIQRIGNAGQGPGEILLVK